MPARAGEGPQDLRLQNGWRVACDDCDPGPAAVRPEALSGLSTVELRRLLQGGGTRPG